VILLRVRGLMSNSQLNFPELAGIATYAEAARIGYSVDENVRRLLRYHWVERRLMSILVAHLTSEPAHHGDAQPGAAARRATRE
jgi:hypothetical protein